MGALIQILRANERMNAYCVKTQALFKKAGYDSCILKGQGNTLYYPSPYIRNAGDIDIWLDGKRWDIFRFVRKYFPNAEFKCQHIEFPVWKQVPVEVHFFPMYLENFWSNRFLQQFFKNNKEKQFSNWKELPGQVGKICIPTPYFNAVYQLTHINVHVLIEGIGLRQFIDYYYVLKNLPKDKHEEVKRLVQKMHIDKLAAAVMYIEKEILGLDDQYLYVEPDIKRGQRLILEIAKGGNFGIYNDSKTEITSFWGKQLWKLRRNSHFIMDYPSEELSEPLFRICHWIWRQWYQLKWKLFGKEIKPKNIEYE